VSDLTRAITVVIPVSPVKSHPSTEIIDETVESVRYWLPDSEIVLTFDGVRPEQEHRRADYQEFIRRALWKADHAWGNVAPFLFDEHTHQVGMLRGVIDEIRSPLMLYVEQDTPLITNLNIEFGAITNFILEGHSNCVRLYHETVLQPEHEHLMHGSEFGYIRTSQWSQRPHVASVAFYHRLLEHFSPDARCFIEDKAYGIIDEAVRMWGPTGWHQFKLHLYAPGGGNLQRSYHIDGRAGEPKFDDAQVF